MYRHKIIIDATTPDNDRWDAEVLHMELAFSDGPVQAEITVCDEGGLADLVQPARVLADEIVRHTVEQSGRRATCRKGCGGCCSYMVPMSVPEALRLGQYLNASTPHRRQLEQSLAKAGQAMLKSPPSLEGLPENKDQAQTNLKNISDWYSSLNLVCPLLADNVCTNYSHRPLACREHIALCGSAAEAGTCPGSQILEMPVSVLETLGQLTASLENVPLESVAMPVVMYWLDLNKDRARQTWPMKDLMQRLFYTLNQKLASHQAAA